MEDSLLSSTEIARRLGVSRQCVLGLFYRGEILAVRVGRGKGIWRASRADLDDYVSRRRGEAAGRA